MTLRESIQAAINTAKTQIDGWTVQLNSTDPMVNTMLNADMVSLKAFFAQFGDKLK